MFPDILLIDGGKGQLNAVLEAFQALGIEPPCLLSLAKQEEEIFRPGASESLKLSKHSVRCGSCNTFATRRTDSPSTTTTCCAGSG